MFFLFVKKYVLLENGQHLVLFGEI